MARTTLKDNDLHDSWVIDSGASHTMSHRHEWFTTFTPLPKPISIVLGDNSTIAATGISSISALTFDGTCWAPALLQDILYVPSLHGNLLSVLHMARCGYKLRFAGNNCRILNHAGGTACTGHLHGNLYLMNIQVASSKKIHIAHLGPAPQDNDNVEYALTACTSKCEMISAIRHRCLGHSHTDTDKNNMTFNDQGGTSAAACADKGLASIIPLLARLKHPSPHHALHTTSVDHDSKSSNVRNNDLDVIISMHTGLSLTPLAARGHVGSALATRLHRQQPDG